MSKRRPWAKAPATGIEITCICDGRAIKGHATTVSKRSIYVLGLHDKVPMLFFASEEGTKWARGWDAETAGALQAANALLDAPAPARRARA
jgi:hypothetical protein